MTLKDKKNKREYDKKLKAQGGVKENDKSKNSKEKSKSSSGSAPATSSSVAEPQSSKPASNFEGVAENADKLITEANMRYLATETVKEEEVDPKYAKRNITSNWTKYELPSDDDEEEDETTQSMTGADFNYVMSSAQGAESHFRLKSEKEWENHTEVFGELSEEFFSLDLADLEKSVASIPLYRQVCLAEEEFEKDMLEMLVRKAESVKDGSLVNSTQVEEVAIQKILDILNAGKNEKPKELLTKELKETVTVTVAEVADVEVQETKPQEVLEQRQHKRRERVKVADDAGSESKVVEVKESAPLGQRQNRRQRGARTETIEQQTEKTKDEHGDEEAKDLKFLENLEKENAVESSTEPVNSNPVVPVTIVGEETKNLEDWLDDFLDD